MKIAPDLYRHLFSLVKSQYENVCIIEVIKIYPDDGLQSHGHYRVGFDIKMGINVNKNSFFGDVRYSTDYFSMEKSEYLQLIRDFKLKEILDENICS